MCVSVGGWYGSVCECGIMVWGVMWEVCVSVRGCVCVCVSVGVVCVCVCEGPQGIGIEFVGSHSVV